MKLLPRIVATFAIVALFGMASTAQAQGSYSDGYGFGTGVGHSFPYPGGGRGGFNNFRGFFPFGTITSAPRIQEPPYFAQFPPVYYSHIVRRPYGISPYAAPPGIAPVEMQIPVEPQKIVNPYFNPEPGITENVPESDTKPADDNRPMLDKKDGIK